MHLFKHKKDKSPKPKDKDKSTERDRSSERDRIESDSDDDRERLGDKVTSFIKPYLSKKDKRPELPERPVVEKPELPERPAVGQNLDNEDDLKRKASMGDKVTTLIKPYWKNAQTWTVKEANDAKKELQRKAGLGPKPDAVPKGKARVNGKPRTVELGWHPVAGATGKWFAEKTIIGQGISKRVGKFPDPTQHWAVIIGDYVHQLWMDGNLDIIYINEKLKRDEWHTFQVGKTRFNDQALLKAGRMTIHNMREKKAAYNLISNNCQNFAVEMLKAIQIGAHREFGTTFAVYQRATGEGAIMDLFADEPDRDSATLQQDEADMSKPQRHNAVKHAQQVMDENTTKMDDDGDERPDERGWVSRIRRLRD